MNYIGIDIIEIARIEEMIALLGNRFLQRVYTESELRSYQKYPASLAARFSGKEAVIKALGLGLGWKEIEILAEPDGQPLVRLHGKAKERASSLGINSISISLSHSREYAVALVIGERQ